MLNPSFKELSKVNQSRYAISIMTSKRAREIIDGKEPLVDLKKVDASKPVTIALSEIMAGKAWEDEKSE
ncbi:MAG: DNA-directed RNA polymerase subunit omega [Finegoldia sp.]|nr:DNA-directed RNA polymerase subunit omega [Finegoldia sp.]